MSLINNTGKFKDKSKKKRKLNTKKLQYGTLSIVLTVVFIAVIVLVNAGASFLTDRFTLKADISTAGLYQISEQTETMLKNLSEPVNCYILMSERDAENSEPYSVAAEFLKRYENLSNGMFTVEYVDTYTNPAFMNQFDENDNVNAGSFIMKSDKRYRVCSLYDLYDISNSYDDQGNYTGTRYISGFNADETFASMLHYVTTGQLPTVAFLTGHGETYGDDFRALFDDNNFEVTEVSLMLEDIPSGTDIIVISAPYTDYTEEEILKLDQYFLKEYGQAMVFMAYNAPELPNLEGYFTEWGVEFTDTLVLSMERGFGIPQNVVPFIQKTDLSDTMSYSNSSYVVAPSARAINVLWEERSSRSTTVELKTQDGDYAKVISLDNPISSVTKAAGDLDGPFNLCVQSQYWEWINNRAYRARILFFGSPAIAADNPFELSMLYNKQYITACIKYLTPESNAVSLTARDMTSSEMVVLQEQANVVLIALVIVLPLLILILGVVVWLRRRNK